MNKLIKQNTFSPVMWCVPSLTLPNVPSPIDFSKLNAKFPKITYRVVTDCFSSFKCVLRITTKWWFLSFRLRSFVLRLNLTDILLLSMIAAMTLLDPLIFIVIYWWIVNFSLSLDFILFHNKFFKFHNFLIIRLR